MTTTFEAGHHDTFDTYSADRDRIQSIEIRPSVRREMIPTSGLWQCPTVDAPIPNFHLQFTAENPKRIVVLVPRSQPKSWDYQGRFLDLSPGQTPPTSQSLSAEQQTKHEEHLQYLQRVSTEGKPPPITRATAKKSWNLWLSLRKAVGASLPIPSAGTGPGGVMFYSWDKDEHHLEAEIFPDRDTEFFYRNRRTGELWGEDYACGALPGYLLEKLSLFV